MNFAEWGNKWLEEERLKKKEYNKKFSKAWAEANPEKIKAAQTKYYEANRKEIKKRSATWRKEHHERAIASTRSWEKAHPKRAKATRKRIKSRYQRDLGFIPLNSPFDGSEGHHIDKDYVVYIPKELHDSIPHCVATGKNMKEINKLALDYFEKRREVNK